MGQAAKLADRGREPVRRPCREDHFAECRAEGAHRLQLVDRRSSRRIEAGRGDMPGTDLRQGRIAAQDQMGAHPAHRIARQGDDLESRAVAGLVPLVPVQQRAVGERREIAAHRAVAARPAVVLLQLLQHSRCFARSKSRGYDRRCSRGGSLRGSRSRRRGPSAGSSRRDSHRAAGSAGWWSAPVRPEPGDGTVIRAARLGRPLRFLRPVSTRSRRRIGRGQRFVRPARVASPALATALCPSDSPIGDKPPERPAPVKHDCCQARSPLCARITGRTSATPRISRPPLRPSPCRGPGRARSPCRRSPAAAPRGSRRRCRDIRDRARSASPAAHGRWPR